MGFISIMNKALFLCLLTVFLFTSCDDGKNNLNNGETSGKINTVSVIIDDELWNGEIGDSLRNKFASPVLGLPQEEPILTINQFPVKLLEGFMYNSRNIIVVKKTSKSDYKLEENDNKNPQIVARFSGKTVSHCGNCRTSRGLHSIHCVTSKVRLAQKLSQSATFGSAHRSITLLNSSRLRAFFAGSRQVGTVVPDQKQRE